VNCEIITNHQTPQLYIIMAAADADLRKFFDSLDLNKNGVLTQGEFITALRVRARKQSTSQDVTFYGFKDLDEIADFFDHADKDGNKEVTFDEFKAAMAVRNAK